MSLSLVLVATVLAGLSGLPGLFTGLAGGQRLATGLLVLASALGLVGAGAVAFGAPATGLTLAWPLPASVFRLSLDPLAALFLVQTFLLAGLASVYGLGYWPAAAHPKNARRVQLFLGILTAGMSLLLLARSAVVFLFGWEVMALSAFLLLTAEDERPEVRETGLLYLITTHVGTLALFGMFGILALAPGDYGLEPGTGGALSPGLRDAVFLLGVFGFGLKAGLMPLHIWLPSAHANAPSHVSAFMSGVLIKMGIYGLVRLGMWAPEPPPWWGVSLLCAGVISAVLGVAYAIGQHDLKRLLAYHSIENIGIIVIGLGLALLGRSVGRPELVVLGLGGALLHTWNHGLFKGLLFLAAGSVIHATGTRELDALGGLSRRMPLTSLAFLVGAVAICGLPPLNGFVSELLVYLGLFSTAAAPDAGGTWWLAGVFAAPALALVGGLAIACFVKVYGLVFLGTARTEHTGRAHEATRSMLFPMAVLAALCVTVGLAPGLVAPVLDAATATWLGGAAPPVASLAPLDAVSLSALGLLVLILAAVLLLRRRGRRAPDAAAETWGCGYVGAGPRVQYTTSSFAQMLVHLFRWGLLPNTHRVPVRGLFPSPGALHTDVPDVVLDRLVRPGVRVVGRSFTSMRWVQQGNVQMYLLYLLLTLIALELLSRA